MKPGRWYDVSNLLSLSRIVLMVPVIAVMAVPMTFQREIAVLIILLAVTTDALDGYLARRWNEESELGKIIDPLADKVGAAIVVGLLAFFGDIPLWFAAAVLARDLIIFSAGLYVKHRTGIILPSLMAGKVAVSFLALYVVLAMLRYESWSTLTAAVFLITNITLAFSMAVYARRFFETLAEHRNKGT